ncbi:hypothetical protein [Asticcacaulis sp.]|uniref:hypothetical protein n=1 Tax=Asticcacaulis sp. TaxID=1872648 RepID=UPI003F7BDDD2
MSQGPGLDDLLPDLTEEEFLLRHEEFLHLVQVADRGDALPLSGGAICAWWGLLVGVTNLYQAAAFAGLVPGPIMIGLIQMFLGWGGTYALIVLQKKKSILLGWRSQAISSIWIFSCICIFIFFFGSLISNFYDAAITNIFLTIVFSLNFATMATSRSAGWLRIPSLGWIMVGFVTFFCKGNDVLLSLVFGLASFAFMLVPGALLWRQEKRVLA